MLAVCLAVNFAAREHDIVQVHLGCWLHSSLHQTERLLDKVVPKPKAIVVVDRIVRDVTVGARALPFQKGEHAAASALV